MLYHIGYIMILSLAAWNVVSGDGDKESKAARALEYVASADTADVDSSLAAAYDFLAGYYNSEKYEFSESVRWYQRSKEAYKVLGDADKEAWASLHIGKLRYKLGRYDKALEYVSEAESIFKSCGDIKGIAECCNILGAIYYKYREYDKSNTYTSLFESYARQLNDTSLMVLSLNNLAVYANRIKDTVKSRSLMYESISLCRKSGDSSMLCNIYLNSAVTFLNTGNTDSASVYIGMVEPYLRKIPEFGSFHYLKGVMDLYAEDDMDSERHLEKALGYYSDGEFDIESRKCHELLEEIYRMRGDTLNAYVQLRACYEIDSRLEKDNVFIDLFEYQNEIIRQKELEKMAVRRNSIILYSVVLCFTAIITAILLYMLYSTRKRNAKELATQKEILEMKKMQEFSMTRLTEDVIGKISSVAEETSDPEMKKKLHMISGDLLCSREPGQWQEVSQYIPEFNTAFYQKLIKDHPSLTTNERRLCTLLNLNMSTKEIAQMTHQTPHSIKIARCRLRAKLGLTGSKITIQEFLSKYS